MEQAKLGCSAPSAGLRLARHGGRSGAPHAHATVQQRCRACDACSMLTMFQSTASQRGEPARRAGERGAVPCGAVPRRRGARCVPDPLLCIPCIAPRALRCDAAYKPTNPQGKACKARHARQIHRQDRGSRVECARDRGTGCGELSTAPFLHRGLSDRAGQARPGAPGAPGAWAS